MVDIWRYTVYVGQRRSLQFDIKGSSVESHPTLFITDIVDWVLLESIERFMEDQAFRLSRRRLIWLLPYPILSRQYAWPAKHKKFVKERQQRQLVDGEGGSGGAELYDSEKASINHSVLSGAYPWEGGLNFERKPCSWPLRRNLLQPHLRRQSPECPLSQLFLVLSHPCVTGRRLPVLSDERRERGYAWAWFLCNLLFQAYFKGTQKWEFFWLRFWNLCFFVVS